MIDMAKLPEENPLSFRVKVDTSGLDKTTEKAERLKQLLEECAAIIGELNQKEISVQINVESE